MTKASDKQKTSRKQQSTQTIVMVIVVFLLALLTVYFGSRPTQYELRINDVSPYNIEAPRNVIDRKATEKRALEARAQVPDINSRSDEISQENLDRVESFLNLLSEQRTSMLKKTNRQTSPSKSDGKRKKNNQRMFYYPQAVVLQEILSQDQQLSFSVDECLAILQMPSANFDAFAISIMTDAESLMASPMTNADLREMINQNYQFRLQEQPTNDSQATLIRDSLNRLLKSNLVFNPEATQNARNEAYERVLQNPILINRGSQIISAGEVISENSYSLLRDLDLVEAEIIDWQDLAGQALLLALVAFTLILYFHQHEPELLHFSKRTLALWTAFFIPLIMSAYFGQEYQLAPPIYFTTVLVAAYFGYQTSLVVSLALIITTLPLVNFNPAFVLISLCGCLVTAYFAGNLHLRNVLAKLVLAVAGLNLASSLTYFLTQGTSLQNTSVMLFSALISGVLSVVAAIGIMPLFEMVFETVSPTTLINLAQPDNPLLKRMFLEIPGTSQHSLMVANLANMAAEAVGADSLLCRVGAYYHDLGKLKNSQYFTENQFDYNPHDDLTPQESASIIISHPTYGVKLGRKYRLPKEILEIIGEHHGTTVLEYFYYAAKKAAEEAGEPLPDIRNFRYPGPIPSSPESGIIMLADSTQAAIKSLRNPDIKRAEEMIERVFKIKIDQNQLKDSGLSFADVELIRKTFIQVYEGHFHERISYPDDATDNSDQESAAIAP